MRTAERELLRTGLEALGLTALEGALDAFMAYLELLRKWNRAYSLTSLKTGPDIVVRHFLDSCLFLKAIDGPSSLADVGSGAGFPGLPMKLLSPETEAFLIEPSRKKAAFLRHVASRLGLKGVTVIEERVEDVRGLEVEAAVTRALFKASDFYRRASHIVREGGVMVLSKGPRFDEELPQITSPYEIVELPLPHSEMVRKLIVLKACGGGGDKSPKKGGKVKRPVGPGKEKSPDRAPRPHGALCVNPECRLRKKGCSGFEGCPGFRGR